MTRGVSRVRNVRWGDHAVTTKQHGRVTLGDLAKLYLLRAVAIFLMILLTGDIDAGDPIAVRRRDARALRAANAVRQAPLPAPPNGQAGHTPGYPPPGRPTASGYPPAAAGYPAHPPASGYPARPTGHGQVPAPGYPPASGYPTRR